MTHKAQSKHHSQAVGSAKTDILPTKVALIHPDDGFDANLTLLMCNISQNARDWVSGLQLQSNSRFVKTPGTWEKGLAKESMGGTSLSRW